MTFLGQPRVVRGVRPHREPAEPRPGGAGGDALATPVGPGPRRAVLVLQGARPRQWIKNLLVFAAPAAAGVLTELPSLGRAATAWLSFSLTAGAVYLLNDVADCGADREHPTKRHRPVASGRLSPRTALGAAGAFGLAGGAAAALLGPSMVALVGAYVTISVAYSTWLKHLAVVELAAVASGFVIRSIAGAVAVGVALSDWFVIVALFGSIFMVTGKRRGEQRELGAGRGAHRPTLEEYPEKFLDLLFSASMGVVILAYCLWTVEAGATAGGGWHVASAAPFTLAVIRYSFVVEVGTASAPEDIVLGDRQLQGLVLLWAAVFGGALYLP